VERAGKQDTGKEAETRDRRAAQGKEVNWALATATATGDGRRAFGRQGDGAYGGQAAATTTNDCQELIGCDC
jgi:hypothetical protein